MSYKVKYVFFSSLTFNTRISHKLLSKVNEMIDRVCLENGYFYVENGNVYENDLFKDRLHLQNSGFTNSKFWIQDFLSKFHCKFTNVQHFFRKTSMVPQYRSVRSSNSI